MEILPLKLVSQVNSHLLCQHCNQLFSNPVINVHCGHTFCRECAISNRDGNQTKCPIDSVLCATNSLVLNRALVSQIEDLQIYCRFGLTWSDKEEEYVLDPSGCTEHIRLGKRVLHEDHCQYAPVSCPNGSELCTNLRQKDLQHHISVCKNQQCPHQEKGCDYRNTAEKVEEHLKICGFRCLQVVPGNFAQIRELENKNRTLEYEMKQLTERVNVLELDKASLECQLNQCMRSISSLESKFGTISKEFEKNKVITRASSTVSNRPRSSHGAISRPTSQSSVASSYSTALTSPKPESWTMPFQFTCIGTLRGHSDVVWCLVTQGSMLYSCGDDMTIKIWDLEALEKGCKQTIKAHEDKVLTLAVTEQFLFSGCGGGCIKVWNLQDGTQHKVMKDAHENIIAAMVCTEDYLFSSSHTLIKVWNILTLELEHTIQGLHHWVRSLSLNKSKEKLYSGSHNTIEIWETSDQFKLKGKITHTYGSVHSLAVTTSHIIAGTYNNNIHIFNVNDNSYVQKLSGHLGVITSVVASQSGRFLFTASSDNTITLWNLENMLPIHSLNRHEGSVNTIVIYNDLLLSGSEDTEIKVFKYSKLQAGFIPS